MPDPGGMTGDPDEPRDGSAGRPGGLEELRRLMIGPELEGLGDLQERLNDPRRYARDVSRVLPEALILRGHDAAISKALAPAVEDALTTSVRANPHALAEALFPVFGPAIRKAITQTLSEVLEGLNRVLEHGFSLESLRWRWEAMRSGKPFAQIVLLHTILYRVEQVFLIHRQTGLLLQQVAAEGVVVHDADMVSGMLTAIRDFVQDSFGETPSKDSLDRLQIGELTVWLVQLPEAVLAAVVRGTAPSELRTVFQETAEAIQLRFGQFLESFSGDAAPLASSAQYLEACLQSQYRTKRRRVSPTLLAWCSFLLLLAVWWGVSWFRENRRWADYVQRLSAEPGLVVVSAESRWGKHYLVGLHDPLARDPLDLLTETGLDPDNVVSRWEPYQALWPRFIVARAKILLNPPQEVTLSFENGILYAKGPVDAGWLAESNRLARALPGVSQLRRGESLESAMERLSAEITSWRIGFAVDDVEPLPGQEQQMQQIVGRLREVGSAAINAGKPLRLSVLGYADASGTPERNQALSQTRADGVSTKLRTAGIPGLEIVAVGRGSSGRNLADDRCVTFEIEAPPRPEPKRGRP